MENICLFRGVDLTIFPTSRSNLFVTTLPFFTYHQMKFLVTWKTFQNI